MNDKIYLSNNGKGWAIFKENPTHRLGRPFAYVASTNEWSLIIATYWRYKKDAMLILCKIIANQDEIIGSY